MIERSLYSIAFASEWGRQMRFITGPRQAGKTTLSKMKLERERTEKLYYSWDLRSVRECYKKHELFFTADMPPAPGKKLWACFDEIHKMPKWKNILKGIFDETEQHYQFIVTGSAKLDISKRAGDSLSGRYFTFRLFPLTLREILGNPGVSPEECRNAMDFVMNRLNAQKGADKALESLLEYGGFPEAFIHQSAVFGNKWSQDYLDRVITEDLGTLTRIVDRDKLYDLYMLLPEMVASPLSGNSLAAHLETSPVTIKNYLRKLEDFYLLFRITPYSKNIKRSLLKAPKCYLYDWTRVTDRFKRFENFIAVQLQTMISLWTDLTAVPYSLSYVRDKNKKETDFLILKNGTPWLMIESKYSDGEVEKHHLNTARLLGDIPVVQVCREEGIVSQQKKNVFRISASKFCL